MGGEGDTMSVLIEMAETRISVVQKRMLNLLYICGPHAFQEKAAPNTKASLLRRGYITFDENGRWSLTDKGKAVDTCVAVRSAGGE